ncbi:ParA family protein [Helicobacter pylori]|uniref:ParA family protein n=1 Tax=Helicobacter pylori TaxID=210 RepID=UPI0009929379|nr:ParA family protein [Helicobacter pylori]NGP56513.1 ParA family protein [Helicobacter pylori]OOQ28109.1 chromosome partitioning protein ParA [Helicobacter pylori]PDX07385.1 chromosome partitioning protein ParA [Helicobacter pylori]WQU48304.1 ParA family protein [Helicobacter pylori]
MTICIANEKGGSGKSTLCLNLAVQLLKDNKEVVVLDTDSQKSMETFATIRAEKERPTFSLFNRSSGFSDTLKQMVSKYENILIDTKGEYSKETQKAMLLSDIVLVPTTPSQLDTEVLANMLERIEQLQELNENLRALIIINRMPTIPTLKERQALIEFIKENNPSDKIMLLENSLSERIVYKRSVSEGLGVIEYSDKKAINEWANFYNELKGYLEKEKKHAL